ncbi:DinB family protein [Angustibacter aerolatus]
MTAADQTELTQERRDLLESLAKHRYLFWGTVEGLTDEQAVATPTASELCLGGLVKHVASIERQWAGFLVQGPPDHAPTTDEYALHAASFRLLDGETLEAVLADARAAAAETDELLRTVPDLDAAQPLPPAPWNPPGATWTARRVFVHLVAEIAQHAGHADILRETLDGRKSMG